MQSSDEAASTSGVRLEKEGRPQIALPLLGKARTATDYDDQTAEGALFRLGSTQEAWLKNYEKALEYFDEMLARFPFSPLEHQVRERIRVLKAKTAQIPTQNPP